MSARIPLSGGAWWAAFLSAAALLGLTLAAAGAAPAQPTPGHGRAEAEQLQRGRYLVRAGDCATCHTAAGGKPFAGGRAVPTPFGNIFAPNITPDNDTGIGAWTADDFRAAMHEGKAPDGRLLYPAFPFTSFSRLSDADVDAMYAWLRTLPPVHQRNTATDLRFPYNMRKLLLAWRALYFTPGRFVPDPAKSAQWNRGAYLVQGLGHCGECHTPRNAWGASRTNVRLAGALIPLQNWYAPDLSPHDGGGLEGWTRSDIVDFLGTGRSARGSAFGPMAEVVQHSLQYLGTADLDAMADYLMDPPPSGTTAARVTPPAPIAQQAELLAEGRRIYADQCAACHGRDGRGLGGVYPPLAGNSALLAADPVNAVRVVLLGGFAPTTRSHPRPYSMPPFVQKLDDRQVAAVVTYLRQSWGNNAGAVAPRRIREYRTLPVR